MSAMHSFVCAQSAAEFKIYKFHAVSYSLGGVVFCSPLPHSIVHRITHSAILIPRVQAILCFAPSVQTCSLNIRLWSCSQPHSLTLCSWTEFYYVLGTNLFCYQINYETNYGPLCARPGPIPLVMHHSVSV